MAYIIPEETGSKLGGCNTKCRRSLRLSPFGSEALFGIIHVVEEGITPFLPKKNKNGTFFATYGML